jgi:cellobiose-specific phosphotransferase system component IIC
MSHSAIVNRVPFKTPPETINDFFRTGQWQSSLLNAVYMIHMISAFPNFLIISK